MPDLRHDPWEAHLRVAGTPRQTPGDDLATAVQRLDDELAIRDLLVRYTYYHDAGRLQEKIDLHHEACVLRHNSGVLSGREAVRAFFAAGPPNDQIRDMRHYVTNTLVRFLGADRAIATSFFVWTETRVFADGSTGAATGGGWYVDVVGRFGDEWLFTDRTINRSFDFYLTGVASYGALQMGVEGASSEAIERLRASGVLKTGRRVT